MGNFSNHYNSGNLSKGDIAISEAVNNQSKPKGSFSSHYNSSNENKLPEIVGTENVIPVAKNDDDSIKVTFDNIYENNSLAEVSKDFYYFRDQKQFKDNKEAINYYINDRTWKQANVVSIGKEFSYITGKDVKKDQLQRYAYLTKTWDDVSRRWRISR